MTKTYIKTPKTVIEIYTQYSQGKSVSSLARDNGVSLTQITRWINDINLAKDGVPLYKIRKKGRTILSRVMKQLAESSIDPVSVTPNETAQTDYQADTAESRLAHCWEQLQQAINEYVEAEVTAKNSKLLEEHIKLKAQLAEEAKKSNKLGFLTRNWRN